MVGAADVRLLRMVAVDSVVAGHLHTEEAVEVTRHPMAVVAADTPLAAASAEAVVMPRHRAVAAATTVAAVADTTTVAATTATKT